MSKKKSLVLDRDTHSLLSCSGSKRWMSCPGSILLVKKLNLGDRNNYAAAEGSAAHKIHELCLRNRTKASDYLGVKISIDRWNFVVDDEMAEAVQTSVSYIWDRIEEEQDYGYTPQLQIEEWLSLKHLGVKGLEGGTGDAVIKFFFKKKLASFEVVDYKHGAGNYVPEEANPQLRCYGAGTIAGHEKECNEGISLTIAQPRMGNRAKPIRTDKIEKEELIDWIDYELVPAAEEVWSEHPLLNPTEENCKWCPAAMTNSCPALSGLIEEEAISEFEKFAVEETLELPLEKKLFIIQNAATIRTFLKHVEDSVYEEIRSGSTQYNKHYKLVATSKNRVLTEDALCPIDSKLLDYLSEGELYEHKPKGIGELKKALKKYMTPKQAEELLSEVTYRPEGGMVLVPITDKRPPVQLDASSEFEKYKD